MSIATWPLILCSRIIPTDERESSSLTIMPVINRAAATAELFKHARASVTNWHVPHKLSDGSVLLAVAKNTASWRALKCYTIEPF